MRELMRRRMSVPVYWMAVILFTVATAPVVSIVIATAISRQNAREQLERYRADQAAVQAENKALYCRLAGSQAEALEDAQTSAGREARAAWMDLYRLVQCQPGR